MEKITVATNKPSFKYSVLSNIAGCGNYFISKITTKNLTKKSAVQKSYKTNPLKTWTKNFTQKYINGLQTFILNENSQKCLVYFHGGAYYSNPTPQHFTFLKELATKTGYKIYFLIYPHLPNYNCSQAITLLEGWFQEIPEKNIMLGGDSSGGGLALALYKHLTINKIVNITKVFTLSPWMDVSLNNEDINNFRKKDKILRFNTLKNLGTLWKGDLSQENYLHSPINIKNWGDTPLLIISSSYEFLAPDIKLFCENNNTSNILWYEYDKLQHVFTLYPCREAKNSRDKIIDFLLNDKI